MFSDRKLLGARAKWLWMVLILLLCFLPAWALADTEYAAIKGGTLNLRETASQSATVLGKYATGTWVKILSEDTTWDEVEVNGKTGYMMAKYLTQGDDDAVAVRYVQTNTGVGVNLRDAPSNSGAVVTGVAEGTKVDVLVKGITWYKVRVDSQTGYIAAKYLSTTAGSSSVKYAVVYNKKSTQVLFLRKTASLSASILGQYKNYTPVEVLSAGTTWCKVKVDGLTGYMMSAYLKYTAQPFAATLKNSNGGSYVNLRTGPGLSYAIKDALDVGTAVTVLDKGTNWTLISVDSDTGYVSTWFLVY